MLRSFLSLTTTALWRPRKRVISRASSRFLRRLECIIISGADEDHLSRKPAFLGIPSHALFKLEVITGRLLNIVG